MATGVTDINVGSDWDEATLSADSLLSAMGNFQNDLVTLLDDDMTSDPGFTEFGSGAGSFSYDAINDDYDIDTRRHTTPQGIFLALGASYDLTDNFRMTFEFTPSVMASGSLSVFGLFNSANRIRAGVFYNNMIALGISTDGIAILYVQNSAGSLIQVSLGDILSNGTTYSVVLENSLSSGQVTLNIYDSGVLIGSAFLCTASLGSVTVDEFGVRNGGSSNNNASIAGDLNNLLFQSGFATSAKSIETEIIGLVVSFDSGDVRFKTDRTLAAGTEVKLYVKLDGGAFGAAINANITPVAGLTGVYQFTAGTNFVPAVNTLLKMEINSPDIDTQIEVSTPWIDGVTVAGAACDYPIEADVRLGTDYDSGGLTGTLAVPVVGNVRQGVAVDDTVGTYVPADEADVLNGEQYGAGGVEFTGSFACDFPAEANVLDGVFYDNGNLEGTLVPTQSSYELPQEVIIEDEEIVIIEECV